MTVKNLREFFSYFDSCLFCNSEEKEISIYYSKYPINQTILSIFDKYIVVSFDDSNYDYKMYIDLDSNEVSFGEGSFGPLAGGDYIFSLSCVCRRMRCESYAYYVSGKIVEPKMLSECLDIDNKNINFVLETNHLIRESTLTISNRNSTISSFHYRKIKLPPINLSSLPTEREKLLTKFNNFLLLS